MPFGNTHQLAKVEEITADCKGDKSNLDPIWICRISFSFCSVAVFSHLSFCIISSVFPSVPFFLPLPSLVHHVQLLYRQTFSTVRKQILDKK